MRWLTRFTILALFLAAATVFWWLDTVREPEPERAPDVRTKQLPDYYLTDFRLERYSGEGRPRQTLTGDRLDHFTASDTAAVTRPYLDYRPADAPAWQIQGDHGTLAQRTDVLELEGAVRLYRPRAPNVRELTLLTPKLRYDMAGEIARTEREVRILTPGSRVDAVGMTAWLGADRVELHNNVRAVHDPALAGQGGNDG